MQEAYEQAITHKELINILDDVNIEVTVANKKRDAAKAETEERDLANRKAYERRKELVEIAKEAARSAKET